MKNTIYNDFKLHRNVQKFDFYFNFVYMIAFIIVIGGFILFGYIGRSLALWLFDLVFKKPKEKSINFIDNSVHYHIHEHKNLTIIDDDTRENILNNKN